MLDTSLQGGQRSFFSRRLYTLWPWALSLIVALVLAQLVVTPSYAWWFTPTTAPSSVTPVHQRGLVVAPITKTLVPQFLLQPLTQSTKEAPPSVEAAAKPTHSTASAPTPRPTLTLTALATPTPQPTALRYSSRAERILQLVNEQRVKSNLPQLTMDATLTKSAQGYAESMQRTGRFSHTGADGSTFVQRNVAAGYTGWSWLEENIAYGQTSPEMVMKDWMESTEHRDNILNPHVRHLGVGIAGTSPIYWVQEFGAR